MTALLVVDFQNDFVDGSLACNPTEKTIKITNRVIEEFEKNGNLIVFGQDSHPKDHSSFKENGGIWPVHGVKGTKGWEIHKSIKMPKKFITFEKGSKKDVDSYSMFIDAKGEHTGLDKILKEKKVNRVVICGLALDYCVGESAKHAKELGYEVVVIVPATGYVNEETKDEMLTSLENTGIELVF